MPPVIAVTAHFHQQARRTLREQKHFANPA